jgi:hypothetical protein
MPDKGHSISLAGGGQHIPTVAAEVNEARTGTHHHQQSTAPPVGTCD